jgi:hypothetical protein
MNMNLNQIKVPFSDDQVAKLNEYQHDRFFHPFTCGGGNVENDPDCERQNNKGEGILIATNEGWVCPCGKYKQNWAHTFMSS